MHAGRNFSLLEWIDANGEGLYPLLGEQLRAAKKPDIARRVCWYYQADHTQFRPLLSIYFAHYENDARDFVIFYEDAYKSRIAPHYEDAFALLALIVTCATTLLAGIASPYISSHISEKTELARLQKTQADTVKAMKYVHAAMSLREDFYFNRLTLEQYRQNLQRLREFVFAGSEAPAPLELLKAIAGAEEAAALFSDPLMIQGALSRLEKARLPPVPLLRPNDRPQSGLDASPGTAMGMLSSLIRADIAPPVVFPGQVLLFESFAPEHVPLLENAAGAIGLPSTGGQTGHLAVVCRGQALPCVLAVEAPSSQFVYLDGGTGLVRPALRDEVNELISWATGGCRVCGLPILGRMGRDRFTNVRLCRKCNTDSSRQVSGD